MSVCIRRCLSILTSVPVFVSKHRRLHPSSSICVLCLSRFPSDSTLPTASVDRSVSHLPATSQYSSAYLARLTRLRASTTIIIIIAWCQSGNTYTALCRKRTECVPNSLSGTWMTSATLSRYPLGIPLIICREISETRNCELFLNDVRSNTATSRRQVQDTFVQPAKFPVFQSYR